MDDNILRFIGLFHNDPIYLNGLCYWFGMILMLRFNGSLKYTDNGHFVCEINNKLYDATGDVTEKYKRCVRWTKLMEEDCLLANRILHECILIVE